MKPIKPAGGMAEVFERYEMKYVLNGSQYERILAAFSEHMEEDAYSAKTGFYPISSLYYDTEDDCLIRNSIEKPAYKEKLRLRSYGTPQGMDTSVFLEIKKKFQGIVSKRRITVPLREAYLYMQDGTAPGHLSGSGSQILREMDYFRRMYQLKPKVYISYRRKALTGKEDPGFRVTFDKDITVRRGDIWLESGDFGRLLLPEDTWIMEIKVLHAMPLWCVKILSDNQVYISGFSKYGTEYKQYIAERQARRPLKEQPDGEGSADQKTAATIAPDIV